ncbi:hypothetical protein SLEP1_g15464 [Rubroshorea leprosula]|uniref:Uncharacterized protein n=1 Tax=Rubroshorea leprosula TaxID=152421 RepID=A0AAV5IME0_9ROSI|nr:hypothetical protein SLEP1_g15464 [Rubroshorea leprosula]
MKHEPISSAKVLRVPSQRPNSSLWLSSNALLVLQLPHGKPNGCP